MKILSGQFFLALGLAGFLCSCNTLEKATVHGFNSGYYKLVADGKNPKQVYADFQEEKINIYNLTNGGPDKSSKVTVELKTADTLGFQKMVFKKQDLDIDITSILLKYRPSVNGLPAQMTSDLNFAMYAGWRKDFLRIVATKDPLGLSYPKINNRGFDLGLFIGPGATLISPFTTGNRRTDEYSAVILQGGFAGFVEANRAIFGFAVGYDYLMNKDRNIWIYNNKPWIGFIVGIALN